MGSRQGSRITPTPRTTPEGWYPRRVSPRIKPERRSRSVRWRGRLQPKHDLESMEVWVREGSPGVDDPL